MIFDEASLAQHVTNALEYPNVGPESFKASFVFSRVDGNDFFPQVQTANVAIVADGMARLANAVREVPTYEVTLTDDDGQTRILKNRVAMIGYGSNSSKLILSQKFNSFAAAKERALDVCVLSATLPDHAVVHGAFLGVRGPVPATIHTHPGTDSTITLGLYDTQAAEHMAASEPNYNGVALTQSARLATGVEVPFPLAYVSVWGALSDKVLGGQGDSPVALNAIPAKTRLKRASSLEILRATMQITDGIMPDAPALDTYIRSNILDENKRFARITTMQELYKLRGNVQGDYVFPSTIASKPQAAALLARFA